LVLALLFCGLVSAQLRVKLESEVFHLEGQSNSFPVTVTLLNEGSTPITVNKWDTPLDDATDVLRADMFEIVHSTGATAEYTGIIVHRRPALSDFVTLNAGQSTTVGLDLFKGYYFPLEGEYKIQLKTEIRIHQGEFEGDSVVDAFKAFTSEPLSSNPVHVEVLALRPEPVWGKPLNTNLTGPTPRSNCNSGQASQINTSGNNAISASAQGYNYLPSSGCSSSLSYYNTWFGACDATRYNKVRSSLSAINNGLRQNYPVDCAGSSCSSNTYAYVYPADTTHTIYVCAVFWRVTTGNCVMDSQPGTLIHEMGHFNNVAGLNDVTYGITNCQNLARNNPGQAVNNADNYCFYTDSCPR
jgi:peptidyl-Lys metalloendopeptidase